MLVFTILCWLLGGLYATIVFSIMRGWKAIPYWKLPEQWTPRQRLSLIIPARNEEDNIARLLDTLLAQNYPRHLVEILVVDDHSEDRTAAIVESYAGEGVRLLPLSNYLDGRETQSFKKAAIACAMRQSTGELIVQTDADCEMGPDWLPLLVSYYEHTACRMLAAPVNFHREKSLLERFQSLDFMGMMGVTGAGIHFRFMRMCNGANLLYEKSVFDEVGGHEGNEGMASGDDMFLMHKVAERYPDRIAFLKNKAATVYTTGKPTLYSFYQQRLRWATKNTSYSDRRVIFVNAAVFFTCLAFFVALVSLPFSPLLVALGFLGLLLGKGIPDFFFLRMMSRFFQREDLMRSFIPSFWMHNAYVAIIGLAANGRSTYVWKGRRVR